ncbi:hypothetical protein GVX82_02095 [Patescibacteria group bacterium]|nr:hypothetical protein [Patescibacteria group bacterium]
MSSILLISGSLRAASLNTALLRAFEARAPAGTSVAWGSCDLPLFSEELEADFPPAAHALKEQIETADAVIIATPEYNRAMSGALKNAIDWTSRPYGKNSWTGKQVLVASVSPGSISGALANYQVKQSLLHLKAAVLPREFLVGSATEKFANGHLTDEKTLEFIDRAYDSLVL